MKGVLITYASLMLCCVIPACRSPKTIQPDGKEMVYYNPANANRTAAEWEPALGTMIVWPLSIPHTLVIELARDNHLFTLCKTQQIKRKPSPGILNGVSLWIKLLLSLPPRY
jgi:hypothetical protein